MEPEQDLILVVDDEPNQRRLMERWLSLEGHRVECFADGPSCLEALGRLLPGVVCVDLHMPEMDGITLLSRIKANHPHLPVIILTADSDVSSVVAATRHGAYDYLLKPIDRSKLDTEIRRALEHHKMAVRLRQLEREVDGRGYPGISGQSPAMLAMFRTLDRLAPCDVSVMVRGESGTGKELIAGALHKSSGRKSGPFVALNCAAIAESLQESELFGHERGAFTGANTRRAGCFEQANGGTLFLDEVAELSLGLQAKLLRVLQERSFRRVGGNQTISSDFRLLAATHQDMRKAIDEGRFREDLYFRIAVFELQVPPLRQRADDVLLLAKTFLSKFAETSTNPRAALSPAASQALITYDWPGNVRELQNAMRYALIVCEGDAIGPRDLPDALQAGGIPMASAQPHTAPEASPWTLPEWSLETLEKTAIDEALRRAGGNATEAMKQLGISRATFYRKLKRYGLR